VRYVEPDRNNRHHCSTFLANAAETCTNGDGNVWVYTTAVEQVYSMGIK